jgi:uncharacterized protein YgbK (DUF1537 family)
VAQGLCLLADDLTGALDSAARFVGVAGRVRVGWQGAVTALDLGTREGDEAAAVAAHAARGEALRGADVAFKKLDSLLRGHAAAEVAACAAAGGFEHVVVAPAFPHQGRVTLGGWQVAHGRRVEVDLAGGLAGRGLGVRLCRAGEAAPEGVGKGASLWDAATEADLDAIVAAGRALRGRVLWCGTGGLAGALARAMGGGVVPRPALPGPVLALIGSDHPASAAQLALVGRVVAWAPGEGLPGLPAAVVPRLPAGMGRAAAAARIAADFGALARAMKRPAALVVAGGATLRGLCEGLGVAALSVEGELEPGAPVSRMEGGLWDGLPILSKSGGFGGPDFLATLLHGEAP